MCTSHTAHIVCIFYADSPLIKCYNFQLTLNCWWSFFFALCRVSVFFLLLLFVVFGCVCWSLCFISFNFVPPYDAGFMVIFSFIYFGCVNVEWFFIFSVLSLCVLLARSFAHRNQLNFPRFVFLYVFFFVSERVQLFVSAFPTFALFNSSNTFRPKEKKQKNYFFFFCALLLPLLFFVWLFCFCLTLWSACDQYWNISAISFFFLSSEKQYNIVY